MDELQRLTIESACIRLMNEFSWRVDAMDYDGLIALFTPDCSFGRADVYYEDHDGLRQSLTMRPSDRLTRHVVSNTVVDVLDGDNARGKAYCVVYGHRGALNADGEAALGAPDSLILYTGEFRRGPQGWRITRWHIGLSFRKPAAA